MNIRFNYEIEAENGKRFGARGETEFNVQRYEEIRRKCFESGYTIDTLIKEFLEKISDEDIEEFIFHLERYVEKEE